MPGPASPDRGPETGIWQIPTRRGNPFVGLRPFQPEEEHLFFGREKHAQELLRRMQCSRFLALVGPSGSGKSSLVRAGLLPLLYGGMMRGAGSRWRAALLRPGSDPIGELARALVSPGVLGGNPADEAEPRVREAMTASTLRRSSLGLAAVVRHARLPPDENLLVVVDQFEEVFRFRDKAAGRRRTEESASFIKLLLAAGRAPDQSIYVLLTMRSDFLGDCAQFRDLPEALSEGQFLIPRLTRSQRRQAIVGPVKVAGATVSPRLVQRLLNDVGDDPDQLPVLQHALMRTWEVWQAGAHNEGILDVDAYEKVGSLAGALSRHADEVYDGLRDEVHRRIAKVLFKALTDTTNDPRGVRRPVQLGEVATIARASDAEVIEVVERFRQPGRSFLMPPTGTRLDATTVLDISHESLMRVWVRLKDWAEEERKSAEEYILLARDATRHEAGRAGLLRNPALGLAIQWRENEQPSEAWARRYHPAFDQTVRYLRASQEAHERRLAEERKKQIKAALVAVIAMISLVSLVLAWVATRARREAEDSLRLATTAVDEMLTRVGSEALADVPQLEEVRLELLGRARALYQKLGEQGGGTAELRLKSAAAPALMAKIEYQLGAVDDARAGFESAIEALEKLVREEPGKPRYRLELSRAHNELGGLIIHQAATPDQPDLNTPVWVKAGDATGAAVHLDRAIELQEALLSAEPHNAEIAYELARSQINRGYLRSEQGELVAAEDDYRAAIDRLKPFTEAPGDLEHDIRQQLARSHNLLANLYKKQKKPAEATPQYERAAELLEALVEDRPKSREYQTELAMIHGNLALHLRRQDPGAAEEHSRRAIALFDDLTDALPAIRSEWATAHRTQGLALLEAGRVEEADESLSRAVMLFGALLNDHPERYDDRMSEAVTLLYLGVLRAERGQMARLGPVRDQLLATLAELPAESRERIERHPYYPMIIAGESWIPRPSRRWR